MDQKTQFFNQWAKTYDDDVQTVGGPFVGYEQTLNIAAFQVKSLMQEGGSPCKLQ
ncbi:hypothetical protein EDD68_11583 [Melghiribacillus thermohalophilus]|uniref:Uncharacterized protein n=2 Tax=Melghiribacillus thermohalophilus TaxID=1324956 RepID=A0A4R3MWZ9_9BACI|nr:hypothetical protein EDD68_11583 [Melghiribacillus thermohalophilus]